VHRSFVHRHPDLHAAVLKAAAAATTSPSPAATAISHRSVLAENANLRELNRGLAQQISDLEDRLSELLGQQAFDRSGGAHRVSSERSRRGLYALGSARGIGGESGERTDRGDDPGAADRGRARGPWVRAQHVKREGTEPPAPSSARRGPLRRADRRASRPAGMSPDRPVRDSRRPVRRDCCTCPAAAAWRGAREPRSRAEGSGAGPAGAGVVFRI
jgi:hypothetical protein